MAVSHAEELSRMKAALSAARDRARPVAAPVVPPRPAPAASAAQIKTPAEPIAPAEPIRFVGDAPTGDNPKDGAPERKVPFEAVAAAAAAGAAGATGGPSVGSQSGASGSRPEPEGLGASPKPSMTGIPEIDPILGTLLDVVGYSAADVEKIVRARPVAVTGGLLLLGLAVGAFWRRK